MYSRSYLVMATSLLASAIVSVVLVAQQPPTGSPPNARNQPAAKAPSIQHHAKAEIKYRSQASLGKGLTKAVMTTGLTVLVQENHAAPVATVRCFVKNTGSAYEGKFLGMGLSHMLEHLVALGSTTKRAEEESQRLLDMMGGQTNAFTTTDLTAFYIDAPAKHTDLAIELIADSMQNSIIPEKEYLREMGVVQRELEMGEADRGRMLHQATKELLYQDHPVRHPTIGYIAVVQQATREDVVAFYKDRYVPQNLVFLVVGDVDTQHVLDEVLKNFQTFQRATERIAVLAAEPAQASPREATLEMEGPMTNFAIAWPTVELQHPDLYALDVASYLLTNGDSSRLGLRLKIDQPLALSVGSASYTPGFVKGWFEIDLECEPDKLEPCRKIVDEELARLQEELVPRDELDKVKRQKAAEHVFGQQRVQEQADSMATSFISTGDPQFDDRYVEGIQSVTSEQVRDVARRYFVAHRTNRVTIDPLGTRRTAAEKSREFEETPPIRRQLSNGLTVLLKRHNVTPVVTIQAFVQAGILADTPEKSGLASLTCETMSRGTEKYSGREIAEYFDSIGGSFSMASQRNTSFLQCLVLADDWEKSLDYVHQVLFKPTFEAGEFEKVKELQLAQIGARQANPQSEIMDFWTSKLPADSPYSRTVPGKVETVQTLTVDDCRALHKQYFVPNNMVLAVFGDIDPDKAVELLEAKLGTEPKANDFEFPKFPTEHQNVTGVSAHLKNQKANTAMVVIGFPTTPVSDVETRAKLEVLNSILTGGGGIGGRLFTELRGERLVYYVYGQELTGPAPGFFFFMAQTRPDTLQEVIKRIQSNLSRIAREGVPAEEFELAKQKLMAAHAMENVTPQSQAFQAAVDELLGLGYEHDRGYDDRISKVKVGDVQAMVQKYFQRAIIATSSPDDSPGSPTPATPTGERAARKK
jgi:zinc protease